MALVKCPECGMEISDSSTVCISCGYHLNTEKKKRRLPIFRRVAIAFGCILFAAGIVFALWKLAFPDIFTTKEEYLSRGDYQSAYKKAEGDWDMKDIFVENLVAVACADCVRSLKDPTSFVLTEARHHDIAIYDDVYHEVVLSVMAKNTYGGYVTNFWVYEYNETDGLFYCDDVYTDFVEEEVYSWDEPLEVQEKEERNKKKQDISRKLKLGSMWYQSLPEEAIDNINGLFTAGRLNDIKLADRPKETSETEILGN